MKSIQDENQLLERMTFVTSIGDFLSFFALLRYFSDLGVPPSIAGYSVVVKTVAVATGGVVLPYLVRRYNTRKIVLSSQLLSFVFSSALLALVLNRSSFVPVLFGIQFGLNLLKQVFEGARETHSKSLNVSQRQLTAQAKLLSSFYGSQFIGPIVSFFLVSYLPLHIPFVLDAGSFLVAGVMALGLRAAPCVDERIHILRPLTYLFNRPLLRDLFFLRSVGFWFSIGLFNYLLFSVITEKHGLTLIHSAWVYSILGAGATVATFIIAKWKEYRSMPSEGVMATFAQLVFGVAILGFLWIENRALIWPVLFTAGIAMGCNSAATQALRRNLTTQGEFAEVVGLELVFGRAADALVSTVAALTLRSGVVGFESWLILASLVLFILGPVHLRFARGVTAGVVGG